MLNSSTDFSVVVPVYNEEESLSILFEEINRAMGVLEAHYELIFVNDGSNDNSMKIMESLKEKHPGSINIVDLPERSGQTFALRKGLDVIKGEVVITLDADLQNDPADILKLVKKMKEGYDVVCGWRRDREDPWLKKKLSKLGNILQRLISGLGIHDVSCTLRAYKKDCVNHLPLDWEGQHRFIPLILSKKKFKISEIVSHHRERKFSISKYTHKRIFKVVVDFFRILFRRG